MSSQIDEYSTEYLARYKAAAGASASAADKAGKYKKANKRFKGIMAATRKQFANETKPRPQSEEVDMLKVDILSEEEYDRIRDLYGRHAAKSMAYSRWNKSHPDYGKTSAQTKASSSSSTSNPSRTYHKVPFAKKDDAKKEGMRWDPDVKKWYHSSSASSAASKFQKEEVEIVSEGPYASGQLKPSKEQLKQAQQVPSGGRTTVIRDKDEKGIYTQITKDGKVVSKVYEEGTPVKPSTADAGKEWRKAARKSKSWSPINLDRYKAAAKANAKNEEVEQVDELKQTTLQRFHSKAKSVGMQGGPKSAKHLAGAKRAAQKLRYGDYSEEAQIDELKKSTVASYTSKVVDPVYGMPRTTKKLKQRLVGLQRAHQRAIGKKPTSEEVSVDEANKVQMTKKG